MKHRAIMLWSVVAMAGFGALAGCASDTGSRTGSPGSKPRASEATVVSGYVSHGDDVCSQLLVARESLADAVIGDGGTGVPTTDEEVRFFEGLFPVAQAYVQALSTLDPPASAQTPVNALTARGYGAEILLWQAIDAHRRGDVVVYEDTKQEMAAFAAGDTAIADRLRGLGFDTCSAEQRWLVPGPGVSASTVPIENPFTFDFIGGTEAAARAG